MRAKYLLGLFLLVTACCKHLPFKLPVQIKAIIEGDIKGYPIRCEKTLELEHGNWNVMCQVGENMEVKYRLQSLQGEQTQVEFLIGKQKGDTQKILAAPKLILNKKHSALLSLNDDKSTLVVKAEPLR